MTDSGNALYSRSSRSLSDPQTIQTTTMGTSPETSHCGAKALSERFANQSRGPRAPLFPGDPPSPLGDTKLRTHSQIAQSELPVVARAMLVHSSPHVFSGCHSNTRA